MSRSLVSLGPPPSLGCSALALHPPFSPSRLPLFLGGPLSGSPFRSPSFVISPLLSVEEKQTRRLDFCRRLLRCGQCTDQARAATRVPHVPPGPLPTSPSPLPDPVCSELPASHGELELSLWQAAQQRAGIQQFEIHSPDAKHVVILRSKDSATAQAWFSAIHTSVSDLLPRVLREVREQLAQVGLAGGHEVRHLGWLAQKVPGDGGEQWKPAVVVLTEKDLLIYNSMPRRKDAWLSPAHSYPLLATRLVHSGPGKGSPQAGLDLSFATRTGTKQGIETHLFRAEVSRDLSQWTRSIVQGCHNSAELVAEVTTACTYKNQECRLTVHYENGFTLTTEPQEGAFPKTIIQSPYEKLKMSSDDGVRMLYLDFGGKEGEIQLDLHSCPKPIVFIIHSFLSAKITRLGLVA
ncbi:Beta-1-syntrophin [Fukomys damarensis]|uniref:Beta-1-syntrophin n=1 Tax=Fukomys damarensis TaxID=885580 RepID=A0A091EIA7_FUKDA|nr:Beta-1-syntrophin [Fukomys damarensis]